MATAVDDRCRALLRLGIYAALVLTPLPFGSVQPWAVLAIEVLAAILGLGAIGLLVSDRKALPGGARRVFIPALALYAIALDWPADGKLVVRSLGTESELHAQPIGKVSLLGCDAELKWQRTAAGLEVDLPAEKPCDHAFVLKVQP